MLLQLWLELLSLVFSVFELLAFRGSLVQIDLKEAILRDDFSVAAHLFAVPLQAVVSATLPPSLSIEGSAVLASKDAISVVINQTSLIKALHRVEIAHSGTLLACLAHKAFIACLVLAVVNPGADHRPSRHNHEEEADHHVANCDNVVNSVVVAADAQRAVVARRVVVLLRVVAMRHSNHCHRDPAEEEDVEPDVEHENHVVVGVAAAHAVVEPDTVRFVAVCALVARLAVMRSWRLDHFAVGAEFASGQLLEELFELELILLLVVSFLLGSLNVAWVRPDADPPDGEKFDADQQG